MDNFCIDELNKKPQRSRECWSKSDIDSLVTLVSTYGTYELNESASIVWQLCDGSRTIKDIAQITSENFEADTTTILPDILKFIKNFKTLGLLHTDDELMEYDYLNLELHNFRE